jgi:hypothetical protein
MGFCDGAPLSAQSASGDLCLASASLHQSGSMALLYSCNSRAGASPASASAPVKYRVGNLAGGHS